MGLYLYATGAQRQSIAVMSHIGISESYPGLTGKPRTTRRRFSKEVRSTSPRRALPPTPFSTPNIDAGTPILSHVDPEDLALDIRCLEKGGTLRMLSDSMPDLARGIASTGLFAASYDNINMVFHAAEQIIGRTGEFYLILYLYYQTHTHLRFTGERNMCYNLATVESKA